MECVSRWLRWHSGRSQEPRSLDCELTYRQTDTYDWTRNDCSYWTRLTSLFNKHTAAVWLCLIIDIPDRREIFLVAEKEKVLDQRLKSLKRRKALRLMFCVAAGKNKSEVLKVWLWNTD